MASSDGWHSVSSEKDELFNEDKKRKIKISHNKIRIALFIKLLKILKTVVDPLEYAPTEINKFLEYRKLCTSESDKISIFKKLVFLGIPCKLYFIINDEPEFVIETFMAGIIEKFKLSKTGLIGYVGVDGSLVNTTLLNSTKFKHFSIFASLISEMRCVLYEHSFFRESRKNLIEQGVTLPMCFNENVIFSAIPRSLKTMKYHPLYVIESMIKKNQIIFPKRPILGYFKGEPIFYKKNVQTLRSEKEWFKVGKKIAKPVYKLVDGVKLYRKYDVEDLIIEDLEGKSMLYYHDNHIPKNCVYSKDELSVFVARLLDICYSECIIGFRCKVPIFQDIFLHKEDASLFFNALEQYKFNKMVTETIERGDKIYSLWNIVIKRIKKFKELKNLFM